MPTLWRRLKTGFWDRGPGLSPTLTTIVSAVALVTAIAAGLDYIALPDTKSQLSDLENAAPLDLWGYYMVIAACMAILGWASHRWCLTILGHAALAGIYFAFGVGVLLAVLDAGDWYGWRPGFARLCIAALHAVLAAAAWRNWDISRDREELRE